jgi:hypothetical protein
MTTNIGIAMWMPVLPLSLSALLRQGWRAGAHETERSGIRLRRGEVRRLRLAPGAQLCAQEGVLWLTVRGDARDHILRAGQAWSADAAATVVIEAVGGAARFSCRCAPRAPR